ncbi:MAG: PAS domain S-box protein [Gemmatimonadetes bacterium]|nr:PAS domain S-box protein [Gemmatimonadota bacterium]
MSTAEETGRRLAAQQAVTRALAASETIDAAARAVVCAIGQHLGWEVGSFWRVHDGALAADLVWTDPGAGDLAPFVEATRRLRLARGEGVPGHVWAAGAPVWLTDIDQDPDVVRRNAARAAGLRSAVAFAIRFDATFYGVLEFFTRQAMAPDATLLDMAAAIGDQMGLFVRRQQAEDALRESAERFRLLAQTSSDVIVVIDEHSTILSINPAVERVFGYAPAELVGRSLKLLMPERMRARHEEGVRHFVETGERRIPWTGARFPGVTKDGREIPLEISFGTFHRDDERVFTGIIRDISGRIRQQQQLEETATELEATIEELKEQRRVAERARAEAEAAAERARFLAEAGRALAGSLAYGTTLRTLVHVTVPAVADYCIVDIVERDGSIRRAELAGGGRGEEEIALFRRRDTPQPDASLGPAHVIATGEPEVYPEVTDELLRAVARDREELERLRAAGLRSAIIFPLVARGRTLGALMLATAGSRRGYTAGDVDILEGLAGRAALALDAAELYEAALAAGRAKSNFLAVMSHELRTPLTAIMGYSDILEAGISGQLNERQREQLKRIMLSARHLLQLIDEILTFSRLEAGREEARLERVPLREFVRETAALVRPAAAEKHLRFEVRLPKVEADLETDPEKLRQILLNILFNAIKFTREGKVVLAVGVEGDDYVFHIDDTGVGIPPEHLEQIFEPFWQLEDAMTRHTGGTGLGLSVARRLVELLGGEIGVRSTPGVGTQVTVRVPRQGGAGALAVAARGATEERGAAD